MPGLMIVLALVLAPAVDSGLKDPWAAGRANPERRDEARDYQSPTGERSDLRNPFESAPPPPPRSADLKDPFRSAAPGTRPTPSPRSADLKDPFDDHDARKRVDPSARTDSLELRNPFAPRPRRRAR